MVEKRLGEDGQRRLRALVDRFGPGNLAARLGLSVDGLGSIISGYHDMSEEGVTNLGLLINALECVPAEARGSPGEEGLYKVPDEDDPGFDPGFDEQGMGAGVVEAGPARIVDEHVVEEDLGEDEGGLGLGEFGGVAGLRQVTSFPDPELVEEVKQGMGVVTEAGARTLERLALESGPSANAAVAEAPGGGPAGSGANQVLGVDLDQDGKPDVAVYGIDLSSRPGMAWMEQQDRRRTSLRNAHVMATMTQFRIGMTRMETVTALGLVTQIELALITYFRESLPEPGQNWDSQKRAREIERRLARLRWVEQQQNDEDSGLKGVWNRVRGRRKPSGKDLYRKMIENADAMVLGMEEPDRDDDVMAEALLFTGAGPEDPGFRNVARRPARE